MNARLLRSIIDWLIQEPPRLSLGTVITGISIAYDSTENGYRKNACVLAFIKPVHVYAFTQIPRKRETGKET